MNRTVRNYVKDVCLKNRTDREILAVAEQTKWGGQREEIKSLLKKRGDKWRKLATQGLGRSASACEGAVLPLKKVSKQTQAKTGLTITRIKRREG